MFMGVSVLKKRGFSGESGTWDPSTSSARKSKPRGHQRWGSRGKATARFAKITRKPSEAAVRCELPGGCGPGRSRSASPAPAPGGTARKGDVRPLETQPTSHYTSHS